jgi:hypothetical protein
MYYKYAFVVVFFYSSLFGCQLPTVDRISLDVFLSSYRYGQSTEKSHVYEGFSLRLIDIMGWRTVGSRSPFIASADLMDIVTERSEELDALTPAAREKYEKEVRPQLKEFRECLQEHYLLQLNKEEDLVIGMPIRYLANNSLQSLGFNTAGFKDFWQHFKGTSVTWRQKLFCASSLKLTTFEKLFDVNNPIHRSFSIKAHGCPGVLAEMNEPQYRQLLTFLNSLPATRVDITTCSNMENKHFHDEYGSFSVKNLKFPLSLQGEGLYGILMEGRQAYNVEKDTGLDKDPHYLTVHDIEDRKKYFEKSWEARNGKPMWTTTSYGNTWVYACSVDIPLSTCDGSQAGFVSKIPGNAWHFFHELRLYNETLMGKNPAKLLAAFVQPLLQGQRSAKAFYIKRLCERLSRDDDYPERHHVDFGRCEPLVLYSEGDQQECVGKVLFCRDNPKCDDQYIRITSDGNVQRISREEGLAAITSMLRRSEPSEDAILKATDGLQNKAMVAKAICEDLKKLQ